MPLRLSRIVIAAVLVAAGLVTVDASGSASAGARPHPTREHPAANPAPELTAATFADPPASVRPKYRWWQPLADTDDSELAGELAQMKRAGGGGAEVAAFGVDGAGNNTDPFLQTYGWGTPLWAQKVRTMLTAAKSDGLSLDLTIGPRWPATVPTVADVNDPAAQQQLVFSYELHPGGTSRSGPLPTNFDVTPPAGADRTLVAALVAKCADAGCSATSGSPRLLDRDSVTDVTSQVSGGQAELTFPGDASSTYALIAFYQVPTGQSLSGYTATGKNYVLDTFSRAGAEATTDFYDAHILTPQVQQLLDAMGTSDLFEDSLELGATEKWTSAMVSEWTQRRGYSPIDVLPALTGAGDQGITGTPFFDLTGGVGARVRTDYRQTLSDLYVTDRLDVLRSWAHRHSLSTRIQPYGVPVDIATAAANIDVPEGESLAFGQSTGDYSNVQDYKVVASGAHLADRPVVSDECCAFSGSVWASTAGPGSATSNLQAVYRGFAGGVNQVVWHGFPYLTRGPAGAGAQEVWPGMTYGGNTSYSEAWGDKGGPNWTDYRAVNDNLARMQLVLRQGQPRFDVAVYWQDFGLNGTGTTGTGSNRLIQSDSPLAADGYTYEYLSPDLLQRKDATYRGGALFGDSSAYHALVLDRQQTMPLTAARKLLALARQGLPVVVVGALPSATPGFDRASDQDAQLRDLMTQLARERSVVRVGSQGAVPAALQRVGVTPAAAHADRSSAILDVRRHTPSADYYYLYNQTGTGTAQTVTLAGTGTPYRLDTWTGQITPIRDYTRDHGAVRVPIELAGNDAQVIAVTNRHDHTFTAASTAAADNGSTGSAQPLSLTDWSLSVDSWGPGASDLPGDTAHTTLGPVRLTAGADGTLPPWSAITPANGYPVNLQDVSGIGTYTAHVTVGDGRQDAFLDLGSAVDTVRVAVNGHQLPPLDQGDLSHVAVGRYLHPGANTVTVRVASTLLNAVRVAPGTGASSRARMDYGLLGPVSLNPVGELNAEAVQPTLPLADGGYNRGQVLVTSSSRHPETASVDVVTPAGITAQAPRQVRVPAGGRALVPVSLRDDGVSSGTSAVLIRVHGRDGSSSTATIRLQHSSDLALNAIGSPLPRVQASASQDRYPQQLAVDGSASTFYVSWGRAAGQGPTADQPVYYGVDFGAPVRFGTVTTVGRSTYGARDYDIQVSDDGDTWRTVAAVTDAAKTGATTAVPAVTARYLRLRITRSWDPVGANVQLTELTVARS